MDDESQPVVVRTQVAFRPSALAGQAARERYHSPNGDRWLLARDPETCRVFVRHEPNLPSGGQVADIEIGAFLIAAGNGPEKQEVLRLIGTLISGFPRGPATFY